MIKFLTEKCDCFAGMKNGNGAPAANGNGHVEPLRPIYYRALGGELMYAIHLLLGIPSVRVG